jgi:uncharacterized membrane protein YccC
MIEERRNQLYRLLNAQQHERANAVYNRERAKRLQAEAEAQLRESDEAIAATLAELERMGERL